MAASRGFKTCTSCGNSKPLAFFFKRKASIDGLAPKCKQCKRISDAEYLSKNKEKTRERSRIYREKNKDKVTSYMARRYLERKEEYKTIAREWSERNPEKRLDSNRKYRNKNKGKVVRWAAFSRSERLKRIPKWGQEGIKDVYDLASWLNAATKGFTGAGRFQSWHVDHGIPLRGNIVSGLHVRNNLKVIPASDNLLKRNEFK